MIDAFKLLPGLAHVKRAMEVAMAGEHSLTIIDCNEMADDYFDAFKAIGGDYENIKIIKPCPCGNLTHYMRMCICSSNDIIKYKKRVKYQKSMRSDIILESGTVNVRDFDTSKNEKAIDVITRIAKARFFSSEHINGDWTEDAKKIFDRAYTIFKFNMEDRAKVVNVTRTIRNLEGGVVDIEARHVSEAIQYRYRS